MEDTLTSRHSSPKKNTCWGSFTLIWNYIFASFRRNLRVPVIGVTTVLLVVFFIGFDISLIPLPNSFYIYIILESFIILFDLLLVC